MNWFRLLRSAPAFSLLAAGLVAATGFATDLPETVWNQVYDSGRPDWATGIAVDGSGNVYVTGWSENGTDRDIRLIKYDPNGAIIWNSVYNSGRDDQAEDVAVDASGNAYVVGFSSNGTNDDMMVIKFDFSGSIIWQVAYNFGGRDGAEAIVYDDDRLYIAGYSEESAGAGVYDIRTMVLNLNGELVWSTLFNAGDEGGYAVAVDSAGSVYVSGYHANTVDNDIMTVKYNSAGVHQWDRMYDSGRYDFPNDLAVDGQGNLYVAGASDTTTGSVLRILIYSTDGVTGSERSFYYGSGAQAMGVATDGAGCVYAGGDYTDGSEFHGLTLKYGVQGAIAWILPYTSGNRDLVMDIAVGPNGYLYEVLSSGAPGNFDFRTIKLRQFLTISGTVGKDNALVQLEGPISYSDTSDGSGRYEFVNLSCDADFIVTPSKPGYSFNPPCMKYPKLGADQLNQDFTPATVSETKISSLPFLLDCPATGTGSVGIRYQLPNAGAVKLLVIDSAGRTVSVLANGPRPAGMHSCAWRAPAAGVYFAELRADGLRTIRKLVVVK